MSSLKKLLETVGSKEISANETVRVFRKGLDLTLKEVEAITGIREPHLSAIENGKIGITQQYAEVFAAAFGLHPSLLLYPNGKFNKSKEILAIEQRAKKFLSRARPERKVKNKAG